MTRDAEPNIRPWLWASAVLSSLGIVVSGYLASKRLLGGSLACTRWAQCDEVNNSIYAKIHGIPVSFIGLAGYLLLLLLAVAALRSDGHVRRRMLLLCLLCSLGGVGFSIYLTYIEVYVIEALCSWCVASAIIISLLAIVGGISLWRGTSLHTSSPSGIHPQ